MTDNPIKGVISTPHKEESGNISLSMTVCIAALAADGKKAILIADKLVTTHGVLPYQVDMAANKIIKINNDVYVMFAGSITDATVIIENTINHIGSNKWVSDIADLINKKHTERLIEVLTQGNLVTRGFKNIQEY